MSRWSRTRALVVAAWIALAAAGCLGPRGSIVAEFTALPTEGTSPLAVHVDASGSYAEGAEIQSYDWDFGDGATGSGISADHTYAAEAETTYTITLAVTTDDGRERRATRDIAVSPPSPPSPSHKIEFVWPFHYDASGDDAAALNDEYFTLENVGSQPVDMTGWSVSNERGVRFRFPDGFTLAPGVAVTIHSGAGADTEGILYWNASAPVWSDTSDIAVLYDDVGDIVDVYFYASC